MSPLEIKKIKKTNLSDEVFTQMKSLITSGKWKPGDRIPGENELARDFGISRVSIRSAIHKLVGMGVLSVRHGDGTFVADIMNQQLQTRFMPLLMLDKIDLREILEFRLLIEVYSARLAAKNVSEEDIEQLRQYEQKFFDASGNLEAFAKVDLAYHNTLAFIGGNRVLMKVTAIIQDLYSEAMHQTIKIRGFEPGLFNHTLLNDAIAKHDEEKAAKIMQDHIQTIIDQIDQIKLDKQ